MFVVGVRVRRRDRCFLCRVVVLCSFLIFGCLFVCILVCVSLPCVGCWCFGVSRCGYMIAFFGIGAYGYVG